MPSRFDAVATPIAGLTVLQRRLIGDNRGYLERMFCQQDLADVVPEASIVQINHTLTARRGTLRGMHFQFAPHAETKIVSCLKGEVFDVAVDLRRTSPTFLRWHGEVLSADNHRTLVIPEGFAHGFQTLTDDCEMLYFHTAFFRADAEGGLNATDPRLAITWPLPVTERSARDTGHPLVDANFTGAT
jgi:dTDP-4-dehydrorhamnose 3,5-epimerase